MVETILYEVQTGNSLAVIKANVMADKLDNVTLSAAPGKTTVEQVPDWQMGLLKRADLVNRINEASKHLK